MNKIDYKKLYEEKCDEVNKLNKEKKISSEIIEKLSNINEYLLSKMCEDKLTSCFNRLGMRKNIFDIGPTNYIIANCDLDKFKIVNDTFGHDIGDKVLKEVSAIFLKYIRNTDNNRTNDFVVRYGGDEFYIFFQNTSSDISIILERIRMLQKEIIDYGELLYANTDVKKEDRLTISIGLSLYNSKNDLSELNNFDIIELRNNDDIFNNLNYMLKDTDNALYQAKKTGRSKIIYLSNGEYIEYKENEYIKERK